jgi:kynureninase
MEVQDVPAIAKAAKAKGALVGCDNTWATPLIFKPLEHGADFACEALTKYVGGHSDLLLGSVTVADMALRQKLKETCAASASASRPTNASSRCAASRRWVCASPIWARSRRISPAPDAFARGRDRAASGAAILPRP